MPELSRLARTIDRWSNEVLPYHSAGGASTGPTEAVTLIDGVPASATRIQVRFKKGDDVWELTADTTTGTAINLAVPNGETDRFPDQNIDWVLFTAIDANEHVVDAGGGLIRPSAAGERRRTRLHCQRRWNLSEVRAVRSRMWTQIR